MRLVKRQIVEKDASGTVVLRPEEVEDLWHAYHLISVGDRVRTTTLRKVMREGATGSTTSTKVKLTLTIEVVKSVFDAEGGVLHLAGVNREENPHVKLGAFHTLHLELNRNFTLEKDCWDAVTMQRVSLIALGHPTHDVLILCRARPFRSSPSPAIQPAEQRWRLLVGLSAGGKQQMVSLKRGGCGSRYTRK